MRLLDTLSIGASLLTFTLAALHGEHLTVRDEPNSWDGINAEDFDYEIFNTICTRIGTPKRLNIKIAGEVSSDVTCAPQGRYPAHKYTKGQIKAAMLAAARLASQEKLIGENDYPHLFKNREKLPFACGSDMQEFPILVGGAAYNGGDVDEEPDRVVYEHSIRGNDFVVKFCGVIRHMPGRRFAKC